MSIYRSVMTEYKSFVLMFMKECLEIRILPDNFKWSLFDAFPVLEYENKNSFLQCLVLGGKP